MSNKMLGGEGIIVDSVDITLDVLLLDTSTSVPKTGLVYTDLTIYFHRERAAPVVVTLSGALAANTDAHTDNKFFEISSANMPGLYRLDFPDALWVNSSDFVTIEIKGALIKTYQKTFSLHTLTSNASGQVTIQSGVGAGQVSLSAGLVSVSAIDTDVISAAALSAAAITKIIAALWLSVPASETYAVDGSLPNLGQFLLEILQRQNEFAKVGTTMTVKRLDGSTTAYSLTLNDATTPTTITRSS